MDKRKFGQQDKRAFRKFADEHAPKSRTGVDCIFAFLTGGTICTIGQGIREMYTAFGIGEDAVKILTPCSLVLISVVLTAFGPCDSGKGHPERPCNTADPPAPAGFPPWGTAACRHR